MTTEVIVKAHCTSDKEVVFGTTTVPIGDVTYIDFDLSDITILQNGEQGSKVVYDNKVAVVLERTKMVNTTINEEN